MKFHDTRHILTSAGAVLTPHAGIRVHDSADYQEPAPAPTLPSVPALPAPAPAPAHGSTVLPPLRLHATVTKLNTMAQTATVVLTWCRDGIRYRTSVTFRLGKTAEKKIHTAIGEITLTVDDREVIVPYGTVTTVPVTYSEKAFETE